MRSGNRIESLPGEPFAGAAEAAHEPHRRSGRCVLVAQRAQAREVPGRRDEHARGTGDRLHDDCRDRVGALAENRVLEVLQGASRLLLGLVAQNSVR